MKTQKERLKEAYEIHSSAHHWMGYLICDGEEDMLAFRKWVLKREQEAIKRYKNTTCNHAWNYTGNHCLKCGENK